MKKSLHPLPNGSFCSSYSSRSRELPPITSHNARALPSRGRMDAVVSWDAVRVGVFTALIS